jgi:hypothetical protein
LSAQHGPSNSPALRNAMPHTWILIPGFGHQGWNSRRGRRWLR